jgi:hypothetical protein
MPASNGVLTSRWAMREAAVEVVAGRGTVSFDIAFRAHSWSEGPLSESIAVLSGRLNNVRRGGQLMLLVTILEFKRFTNTYPGIRCLVFP